MATRGGDRSGQVGEETGIPGAAWQRRRARVPAVIAVGEAADLGGEASCREQKLVLGSGVEVEVS